MDVVLHCMDLQDVKVGSNLLVDELILVCVKAIPRVFQLPERAISVCFEVSIVDEIKDSTGCLHNLWVSGVGNHTKKHLLHVLMLISSPLGDEGYSFLEMAKTWVPGHRLETLVNFMFTAKDGFGDPLDQMILEDAFVGLVKDVRSEGGEDVAEGEIFPEWVNDSQAILCKVLWCVTICDKVERLESVARVSE